MFELDNLEDVSFTINESYAKRFEHNKKREELHRCEYFIPCFTFHELRGLIFRYLIYLPALLLTVITYI